MSVAMNRLLAVMLDYAVIGALLVVIAYFEPPIGLFSSAILIAVTYYPLSLLIMKGQTVGTHWRRLIIVDQTGEVADFGVIRRRLFTFLALALANFFIMIPGLSSLRYAMYLNEIEVTSMSMGIYYSGIALILVASIPIFLNTLFIFIKKDKLSFVDKYSRTQIKHR